ncbi:MAG: ADP-ribosylglycohydrolase family protein [Methylacidiphilales bacterium]|nr:ADP-ribosylglycohydrolase family protein [Candidatus Methylacidiphilales bacterium]
MKYSLPEDYEERVYAGVLGKLIGVYLGRPFEGWPHKAIADRWGEIRRYVHEDQKMPLIVTDDDITGTFTFVRALLDHGISPDLSSKQIGQTWLNYIAEGRHILWWGGMGMSTEHTAWLRLQSGVEAPRSGSAEINGTAVAEEIGAQIFIDGWAMVAPGQPDLAVRLAREAARVSHDGEAVHGAVVIAAMESLAFVEKDIDKLIGGAISYIPADSRVAQVIADLRLWHKKGLDWHQALAQLIEHHGYEHFQTNCPMVPNHGVIILALLYGGGDFDRSLMIVNTCGYDTDCNAGNLGCLLGIRNGLDALRSGYDWRTPVNDRMYLPAADGHWGLQDAANIALELANIGRVLAGSKPREPKQGARYHFSLPGSTHGFAPSDLCPKEARVVPVEGILGEGSRSLQLEVAFPDHRCDAEVFTFLPPSSLKMSGYSLTATPTLYPGDEITARVVAGAANHAPVRARLFVRIYQERETVGLQEGPWVDLRPGEDSLLRWAVPTTEGWPVAAVGVQLEGPWGSRLHLDWLTWGGTPTLTFDLPKQSEGRDVWERMFIGSMDANNRRPDATFNLVQNRGRGVLHTGSRVWKNYRVSAKIKPLLAAEWGLVARVQGLTRYYGLFLRPGNRVFLVRMAHDETMLAETSHAWKLREEYELALEVRGNHLAGWINGQRVIEAEDPLRGLESGGIGFVLSEGRIQANALRIEKL